MHFSVDPTLISGKCVFGTATACCVIWGNSLSFLHLHQHSLSHCMLPGHSYGLNLSLLNQQEWKVQMVLRMYMDIYAEIVCKRGPSAKQPISRVCVCVLCGSAMQRLNFPGFSKTHIIYMTHSCRGFCGMQRVNRDSNHPLIQFTLALFLSSHRN